MNGRFSAFDVDCYGYVWMEFGFFSFFSGKTQVLEEGWKGSFSKNFDHSVE